MANLIIGENSYIGVEDAETYFLNRLYSDIWDNSISTDKEKALIMATKKIDSLRLKGIKADTSKKLQFPRALYSYQFNKWIIESDVEQCIKDAVCEEALVLLKGIPKRVELQNQGVKSMSIGNVSETYAVSNSNNLISIEARELMKFYIAGSVVTV